MRKYVLLLLFLTSLVATSVASTKFTTEKTFCDGWEEGYKAGFSYHNIQNRRIEPIFTTPICPIPKIGFENYQVGYNRGLLAGKKKFEKRNPDLTTSRN
ncbi:MAG: hypothetical protein AB8B65_14655 [Kordia sp.]|uniref:hypothetical protein n=1 Tax=Kordia sp. TaxID=1965332 RepID=UPI00385D33E6